MKIDTERKFEKVDPKDKKGLNREELEKILKDRQKKLSMEDWDIAIEIVDFKRIDYKQSGDFRANPKNKTGTILLTWNPFIKEADSIEEEEKKTILHELIHIMLWECDQFAEEIILEKYKKYGEKHLEHIGNIEDLVDHLTKKFFK